jgi:predicted NAD/FAD-dependent oxidoreductase
MRTVIIGAGLAGLMAARSLHDSGHEVTVLDKGRGVGGRLATRRIGEARLDHGAQFFTVRSDEFRAVVDGWLADGVVREWCRGFGEQDGHPRYVGSEGMTSIAKHLARGLDVRTGQLAFTLRREHGRWQVRTDDGADHGADRVILTAPVAQSFSFLMNIGAELPAELRGSDYDRTLALLAVLDSDAHSVPAPGGVQNPSDDIQFVADNKAKGISPVPAITVHFSPAFSEEWFDRDLAEIHAEMLRRAAPWFGSARITASEPKKWRFATPRALHPERCWTVPDGGVVMAGDVFGGPKVEGAALSGLAAARAVLA